MKIVKFPKQSQYPKTIFFSDCQYKIIFKKKFKDYGETDSDKKTITIKSGLSPRIILITFIHELLHVIEFEHPMKLKHKAVYKLERAISELLMDNFL